METKDLYRYFDGDGTLLYIGLTRCAFMRLHQHMSTKPWACDIATITIEKVPAGEAEARELAAVQAEKPAFNRFGQGVPEPIRFATRETFREAQRIYHDRKKSMQTIKRQVAKMCGQPVSRELLWHTFGERLAHE